MFSANRIAIISFLFAALLATTVSPRAAQAGVSDTVLAIVPPLAEQFGVPASAVTGLLEGGISLDSVTQLLLVSKSSEKELGDVTKLYRESGDEIGKTATKLDVAAADYSPEKVKAAIDEATAKAQADAAAKAGDAASSAVDSALGGLNR